MERPGQWAAHPQPRMWYYAGPPYGSPGMQHSGVPYRALSMQYVPWPLAALPAHTSHPAASPWEIAQTSHRAAQPCHIGSQPTAQPEQKRELDPTYCMVDEKTGDLKSFASISQVSGAKYEGMISQMFCTSGPRELRAVFAQRPEERERLEKCRAKVEEFLQKQLPGPFANRMNTRGVGEELAEIDAVHTGSFKAFAEKNNKLGKVVVAADADVEIVLVEICSDSRFVAKKLYQIEIQSSLLQRSGYLVRDNEHDWEPINLQPRTTGFAIVFNRAALSIDTQRLARDCQLTNVLGLLEDNKLHILYFSSDEALPAALAMATEAREKAEMALRRLEQGMVVRGSRALAKQRSFFPPRCKGVLRNTREASRSAFILLPACRS